MNATDKNEIAKKEADSIEMITSDMFPVVRMDKKNMDKYQKIPFTGIAALGAAFSQIPEAARTIVQTTTTSVDIGEQLYVGINPKGVEGFLRMYENGTSGNIMQINEQGKQVIAGRMRFKPLENALPVTETNGVTVPFDPMMMVVAVAIMRIEKKLDAIHTSIEEVLQFLKLEKQSRQRGNLNMLSEILEEYKQNCDNEKLCTLRNVEVQTIKREAHQDILFYQEQIASKVDRQKKIHGLKNAKEFHEGVAYEFAEYQLACYLYSFATFLDMMLQKSFETHAIEASLKKMNAVAERYNALYEDCRAQIANYQRTAIETQLIGGVGSAAKTLGKAIAAVPVVKEGPVDEALIGVGDSIGKLNKENVKKKLNEFETLRDNRMGSFIDNLEMVDCLYNTPDSLLTDGEALYVLQ